ncbi:capsid assembly protein [Novispirillum sp. DQ9]|uniref:capsid assembly protein n=1 Tax=Novispirillum sp. DQ9 TaxID=3398612 RepID=UPI003C7BF1CE
MTKTPDNLLTLPPAEVGKAADAAAVLPVAEAIAEAQAAEPGVKPDFLPDAFWDAEAGEVRLRDLADAFSALEARAGAIPDSPDGYEIAERHPLLASDPDLNALLHGAGFSPEQAQLVYDLAADRVLPMIEGLAAEFEADRQLVRLVDHFGGEEGWAEVSRQILAWGRSNLPAEVLNALATTYEGVIALHGMMGAGEPALGAPAGPAEAPLDEDGAKALMRDPRYWRDRDPALVRKVGKAFERLYPGQ